MELSAKIFWPVFPLLLLLVIVCLTWGLVWGFRRSHDRKDGWIQVGALSSYLLAAMTAIASESGVLSVNIHRPLILLTQCFLAFSLYRLWGRHGERMLMGLNIIAWVGILADTALHFLLVS